MSNLDNLKEKISNKITNKTTLRELIIEVNCLKEVVGDLIDLIKSRNF